MDTICTQIKICIFMILLNFALCDETPDLTMKKVHEINLENEIEHFKAAMLINSNWEENIMATPLAVNMLSLLALIASTNDFSMHVRPQAFFELKVDTFQAAIVQLSEAAALAFENAKENAFKIENEMVEFSKLINKLIEALQYKDKEIITIEINVLHQLAKQCNVITETIILGFHSTMMLIEEIEEALGKVISENRYGIKTKSMMREWKHFKKINLRVNSLRNQEKVIEILNEELKKVEIVFKHRFENISSIEQEILGILRPKVNIADGLISSEEINQASLQEENEEAISNLQKEKLSNQISIHIASSMVDLLDNIETQLKQIIELPGIIRLPTEYYPIIKFSYSFAKVSDIVQNMLSSLEGSHIQGLVTKLLTGASDTLTNVSGILKAKKLSSVTPMIAKKGLRLTNQISAIKHALLAISSQSLVKNKQSPFKSVFRPLVINKSFVQPNDGLIAETQHRLLADLRNTMGDKNLNFKRQIEKQTSFIERSARKGLKSIEPKEKMSILKNLFEKLITVEKSWMDLSEGFKILSIFLDFGLDKRSEKSYNRVQKRGLIPTDFLDIINPDCMHNYSAPGCNLFGPRRPKHDKEHPQKNAGHIPKPPSILDLPDKGDGHIDYPPPPPKPEKDGKSDRKPKIQYPPIGQHPSKEHAFVFDLQATTERLLKAAAIAQNIQFVSGLYKEVSMMFVSDQLIEIPNYVMLVKSEIQPKLDQLITRNADALYVIQREAAKQSNLFEEFMAKSEKSRKKIYKTVGEPSKEEKEAIDIGVKLNGEHVDYTKALGKYWKEIPSSSK